MKGICPNTVPFTWDTLNPHHYYIPSILSHCPGISPTDKPANEIYTMINEEIMSQVPRSAEVFSLITILAYTAHGGQRGK